jgi:hypothetical protein
MFPTGGFLHLYRVIEGGAGMQLLHKTPLDGVATAICPFQDKLVVGMGKTLRMYDLGKKKLLRKCELRTLPTFITTVQVSDECRRMLPTFITTVQVRRTYLLTVRTRPTPSVVPQHPADGYRIVSGAELSVLCFRPALL